MKTVTPTLLYSIVTLLIITYKLSNIKRYNEDIINLWMNNFQFPNEIDITNIV